MAQCYPNHCLLVTVYKQRRSRKARFAHYRIFSNFTYNALMIFIIDTRNNTRLKANTRGYQINEVVFLSYYKQTS